MLKKNIAIFVSGSGSNCENLIRYFEGSEHIATPLVISNKPDAYALVRAYKLGIPAAVVSKAELNNPEVMLPLLHKYDIHFIVLAGFLPLIPDFLIAAYPHKIVNLHPALLPKYGGKGMWGHHVHEASKAAGERYGTNRLEAALNRIADGSPEEILHSIRKDVDAFVNGAKQFDDLTMLCLMYKGESLS